MFDATYVRAPFLVNTLASGWFAVTEVSTLPSAARLRIQWKVCALLSPSSEVNPLLARKLASAASAVAQGQELPEDVLPDRRRAAVVA